jgi:integrase/recombinase XerD
MDEDGRVIPMRGLAPSARADQVLSEMLTGWRHQQLARNLAFTTIDARARVVARFIDHCNEMPSASSSNDACEPCSRPANSPTPVTLRAPA